MREIDCDVLVVGGGPAGLSAAYGAARALGSRGRVVLVHRDRRFGYPVRTSGGSWAFHLKQLGIPEHLWHTLTGARFASPNEVAHTVLRPEDPAVSLDVTATYEYLAELARQSGATVLAGMRFVGCEAVGGFEVEQLGFDAWPEGGFVSDVRAVDGEEVLRVRSRLIVDASGSARAVSVPLGLQKRAVRYGVGAEYEVENLSEDQRLCLLLVGSKYCPAGYGWALPTMAGTVRVGVGVLQPDVKVKPGPLLDELMISGWLERLGVRCGKVIERHVGVLPSERPNERCVFGPVVCVGDTAMQALPLIGEGIRYCIEAGREAGKACAAAALLVRDDRSEDAYVEATKRLRGYERWWRTTHGRAFDLTWRMNVRIARFTDDEWDRVTRVMQGLSPESVAKGLRGQVGALDLMRFALTKPRMAVEFGRSLLGV